jgi:hypothetical protein
MKYLLCAVLTLAAMAIPATSHAEQALTVGASPVFSLITANPGSSTTRQITLTNSSDLALNVSVESRGFTATDDKGGSDFPNSKSGPQHWFSFSPSTFSVPAHSSFRVPVTISVPKDTVSGGHYASVFFIASAQQPSTAGVTQINFSARVGTFFFMTVGGNLHPDGKVVRFSTKLFWQQAPIRFKLAVHNFGNIHIKPHSVISITNVFGKEVYRAIDPGLYVLPGKSRNSELASGTKLSPGYYSARLTTKITSTSKETVKTVGFWVIPWQLFLIVLFVLMLGAILIRPQLIVLKSSFVAAGGFSGLKKLIHEKYSGLLRVGRKTFDRLRSKWKKP